MKRIFIDSKGSFTVEASIIFSVVFLLICAMVYLFIIMYQYVAVQSVANQASNYGATYYVKASDNPNLYWRIIDTEAENKKRSIAGSIDKSLNRSILASKRNVQISTSYKLLIEHLNITIEEEYPIPMGSLFEMFGMSSKISVKAQSITPLDDKAEFIRNVDTVIDIKNCIFNSDNKWIGKDSKVNDVISKLITR